MPFVESRLTKLKPRCVSCLQGAALADSPVDTVLAVEDVNLARDAGAAFVAATSTDYKLLTALGADLVVDYTTVEWSTMGQFRQLSFDVMSGTLRYAIFGRALCG